MKTHRGYRFRIYPTPQQEARLLRWEGALADEAVDELRKALTKPKSRRRARGAKRR